MKKTITDWKLKTPVAFFIFNRPDETKKVFNEIAKAMPPKLFVIADGPREDNLGEAKKCADARAIIDGVDWDCELLTNYSDVNMGCKHRVSSGLDWVFNTVGEAIILEDDCLPHPSFFRFCQELLKRYEGEESIAHICGADFLCGTGHVPYSYTFSRYTAIWGWATWRRAWRHYDVSMKKWPEIREYDILRTWLNSPRAVRYWSDIFERVYRGKIDTWDYQWLFACWVSNLLSIRPAVNLISNIGFGPNATHTLLPKSALANMETSEMTFPLAHPPAVMRDATRDNRIEKKRFSMSVVTNLIEKFKWGTHLVRQFLNRAIKHLVSSHD